jgi:Uma2 family endonuclease
MTGGNVPFVVEVADTSLRYDLKRKQRLYAGFGIREMWVINARTKITHVHRSPTANGYADIKTFQPEDFIAPQFSEALGLKLSELEIY